MIRHSSRGSLAVELIVIMIPFMFCFMTLLHVSRVVEAEVVIHHAITQTAKEISTFSYILTKSGAADQMIATNAESAEAKGKVSDTIDALTNLGNAVGDIGSTADISGQIESAKENVDVIKNNVSGYIEDPKSIARELLAVLKSGVRQEAMKAAAGKLSKGSIKKQLGLLTQDPDAYLKYIGIVDGLEGLDFSESSWCSSKDGKGEIQIVVTFTMKNIQMPMMDFGEHKMVLCASTLIW